MASIFNGKSLKLKYLFTAYFEDGTLIDQGDDKSLLDEKRSRFFDVLEYEKTSKLVRFSLISAEVGEGILTDEYSVDLTTGVFSVNGVEFEACDQNFIPTEPLRIVYFRETRVEKNVMTTTGKVISERFYVNKYYIGWQTTYNGTNYQRTIAIKG